MKKIYHLCLSSLREVLFRNEEDFTIGFNYLAEAAFYTESRLLADGFMSTHWHNIVRTEVPDELTARFRYAYSRYFNAKYGRIGRLAERDAFITEIDGICRLTTALNYVNRQGLHHGVAETAFGYAHCSVNSYFRKDLGRPFLQERTLILPERRYRYLLRDSSVPLSCRMDISGHLLREDVLDTAYVEHIYVTPRNYLFQMNKLTDESQLEEQRKEKSGTPLITLDLIETGTPEFDVKRMLTNERGRVNRSWLTDQELCWLIDNYYVPWLKGGSAGVSNNTDVSSRILYACSREERISLAEAIDRDLSRHRGARIQDKRTLLGQAGLCGRIASAQQIRRCLAI